MKIKTLIMSLMIAFMAMVTAQAYAEADDCQINITDTGVHIDIVSVKKTKQGNLVKLNYNNTSENNYQVTAVKIKSCQIYPGENDMSEVSYLAGGYDKMTREYMCDSTFNKNHLEVEMYMKEKGQDVAVAACDVVKARH